MIFPGTMQVRGTEFTFKQNTFFTVQLTGEHSIAKPLKFKWYGAFNILDGYIPDQRRMLYTKDQGTAHPYTLLISNTLSQQSGSRIFQTLSDYIYTAGGDLVYTFNWLEQKQTVKGGYMLQIKDRLYDAQLFANYLPADNPNLKIITGRPDFCIRKILATALLPAISLLLMPFKNKNFRYMANTILNAGFLQFDNQFTRQIKGSLGFAS